jgi:hypothetical protein
MVSVERLSSSVVLPPVPSRAWLLPSTSCRTITPPPPLPQTTAGPSSLPGQQSESALRLSLGPQLRCERPLVVVHRWSCDRHEPDTDTSGRPSQPTSGSARSETLNRPPLRRRGDRRQTPDDGQAGPKSKPLPFASGPAAISTRPTPPLSVPSSTFSVGNAELSLSSTSSMLLNPARSLLCLVGRRWLPASVGRRAVG